MAKKQQAFEDMAVEDLVALNQELLQEEDDIRQRRTAIADELRRRDRQDRTPREVIGG
jgi:hypothetical protein